MDSFFAVEGLATFSQGVLSNPFFHVSSELEDLPTFSFLRKEVIQPQLPLRLPCYDFVPVTGPTFGGCLLAVSSPTSGVASFHDVTGGVYKARERIHRSVADPRLLATPTSCRRVAACNPNYDRLWEIRFTSRFRCSLYRPL